FPTAGSLREHVRYTQSGIRALPYVPGARPAGISRRHMIHAHALRGLYSVVGGKLTTHRAVAAAMLEALARPLRLGRVRSRTAARALPGATTPEVEAELR